MSTSTWELACVPAEAMQLWCDALRDDNAIHFDAAAAEALGFGPRTVNPGPINLAYLLNMVMEAEPDAHVHTIEAALLGNVLAHDRVTAHGTWRDEGKICEAVLTTGTDQAVLSAQIEIYHGRSADDDGEGVLGQRL
jgi:hypothetical protein